MSNLRLKVSRNPDSINIDDELDRMLHLSTAESDREAPDITLAEKTAKLEAITPFDPQLKKKATRKVNKYFYKFSNHHELFKIGTSFYMDYLKGMKSFALISNGREVSTQTSILGLASFFDHKEDIKIGIISNNIQHGSFEEIKNLSLKEKILIRIDLVIDIYNFYDHFHLINLNDLIRVSADGDREEYEEVFTSLTDHFDVVFWDIPGLREIQQESEKYFPMIMSLESLTIIVSKDGSSHKGLEETRHFFLGYGLYMKGILVETQDGPPRKTDDSTPKKKNWWNIFG